MYHELIVHNLRTCEFVIIHKSNLGFSSENDTFKFTIERENYNREIVKYERLTPFLFKVTYKSGSKTEEYFKLVFAYTESQALKIVVGDYSNNIISIERIDVDPVLVLYSNDVKEIRTETLNRKKEEYESILEHSNESVEHYKNSLEEVKKMLDRE